MIETALLELQAQLPPQALFAIVGGLIGAIGLAKPARDGYLLSAIFVVFGVACALIASDYLLVAQKNKLLAAHIAVAIPVGGIMGATMMAVRAITPKWADRIVKIADTVVEGMGESTLIKGLKLIFGIKDKE